MKMYGSKSKKCPTSYNGKSLHNKMPMSGNSAAKNYKGSRGGYGK